VANKIYKNHGNNLVCIIIINSTRMALKIAVDNLAVYILRKI